MISEHLANSTRKKNVKFVVEQSENYVHLIDFKDIKEYGPSEDDYYNDNENASDYEESSSDIEHDHEKEYRQKAFRQIHLTVPRTITPPLEEHETPKTPTRILMPSLFPKVPPYVTFSSVKQKGPYVPPALQRVLKWRTTKSMPNVVRRVLLNSGMRLMNMSSDFMGCWDRPFQTKVFKRARSYQKMNHLPGSHHIGHKDFCWHNLQKKMNMHGGCFGFMPQTFIVPKELKELRQRWPIYSNHKWIVKPAARARGLGIRVVNSWAQIPEKKYSIVQKYIERPFLINGSKFDLRLYVLVTSVNPLRIFMYHDGLVRFASEKYSDEDDTLKNRFVHLTNYSVNKFAANYARNRNVNGCDGHKWTVKALWNYLAARGIRTDQLWEALHSLVLHTVLAGESPINKVIRKNARSKYNYYELFGFDVLLDSELIPWLLEVNICPSLNSDLPLDTHVKAPLVQSVLNTVLFQVPPNLSREDEIDIADQLRLPSTRMCLDRRMYTNSLSCEEKIKHRQFTCESMQSRDQYLDSILHHLTPDDVRCLIVAEDELARCKPLKRIFPTSETYKYLEYTAVPRYYNRLLDAWEMRYGKDRSQGILLLRRYCDAKYHLKVPSDHDAMLYQRNSEHWQKHLSAVKIQKSTMTMRSFDRA